MAEEGIIGLVLARVIELRLKINNCVNIATPTITDGSLPLPLSTQHVDANGHHESEDEDNQVQVEEEEPQILLNICDALKSLETQLTSLQVLQQQQQYEREVALAEIENSRRMLIDKLHDYKGKELEVILEASTFAGDTVEHRKDLLLPPYPNSPPYLCLDNEYLPQIPSVNRSIHNGSITLHPMIEAKKSLREKEHNVEDGAKNLRKGMGFFITSAAKTVLTVVGMVSILSLSGVGNSLGKLGARFSVQDWPQQPKNEDERPSTQCWCGSEGERPFSQCPPGRILVVENGEVRCLVKERVEIPFSAAAATTDINYGCG